MKKLIYLIALPLLMLAVGACEKSETAKGTLTLSMTDAPIDTDGITGVYITVTGIQYNLNGDWVTADEFEGPKSFNLLDLTRGESELLGSFELNAGSYNQIRFLLDIPNMGQGNVGNPGCYIMFNDQSTEPLFVPSGAQSGYKAVGNFDVPVNGSVAVTADFDVRKAVVLTGSGKYILKPTIRLVVDNQAGSINGTVANRADDDKLIVYAYAAGTYSDMELIPTDTETQKFANAISSDVVDDSNLFRIAYLAPGSYDLVVTTIDSEGLVTVEGIVSSVAVESNKATNVLVDMQNL